MTNADDSDDENRQLAKILETAQERKHEHDALSEGGVIVAVEPSSRAETDLIVEYTRPGGGTGEWELEIPE